MAKKRSALERVRNNPNNATFKDLQDILEMYGFKLRDVSGDHFQFKRPGFRTIPLPRNQRPVSIIIVNQVLSAVDLLDDLLAK